MEEEAASSSNQTEETKPEGNFPFPLVGNLYLHWKFWKKKKIFNYQKPFYVIFYSSGWRLRI